MDRYAGTQFWPLQWTSLYDCHPLPGWHMEEGWGGAHSPSTIGKGPVNWANGQTNELAAPPFPSHIADPLTLRAIGWQL